MDMKNDGKFMSFPQDPSREALGRVLGEFGEVRGRFLRCFFNIFCKVFLGDFRESPRGRLREYQGNLANPSEP